ncbi:hypothetical protein JCM5353_008776 [Sporobolomyces roseus]
MSIRYFDTLPTELVGEIVQDVDCLPRQERHVTLRSLCLTSKLLRSHAQPLLLKRIYTSVGAGQDLLKLLVENNASATLATIQALIFDIPDLKKVSQWLKKFVKNATNLQEAYVNKQVVPLKAFFGSNITTLSFRHITMKLDGAVFALPELLRLSMIACPIHNEGGIRFSLPKLKHLAFFGGTSHLWPQEFEFLNRLVPNLVSFTVSLDKITSLPPSILNHPTLPILYKTFSNAPDTASLQGIQHLLIQVHRQSPNIPEWAVKVKNSMPKFKTLTLAWYGGGSRPDASVTPLLVACRDRNVEVFWEHHLDPTTFLGTIETFFDLVPSSFIERAEARQRRT